MLLNFDEVKYAHEEYERQLAAFRLDRKLRKARSAATPKLSLVTRCVHLLSGLTAMRWNRTGRGVPTSKPAQRWQTLLSGK